MGFFIQFNYIRVCALNTSQWTEIEWILSKKATTKRFFVVVVFGTNMRWKKEHDVILMSIINLFFFNASKHHSLFGFLRIFLFPFIDRFNNVRYVRAMRIHLYSIEWYMGHFFRLKYINYSTLSRWSLFMGYKCVDLYLIRPHTLQILTPHGTQFISNKNTRNVFFFYNVQIN